MPAVESIPHDYPMTLIQNVIYALPPGKAVLFTDTATPTLQQSLTYAFTNNVAVTLTNGMGTVAGGFIRSTAGNANIVLSKD